MAAIVAAITATPFKSALEIRIELQPDLNVAVITKTVPAMAKMSRL